MFELRFFSRLARWFGFVQEEDKEARETSAPTLPNAVPEEPPGEKLPEIVPGEAAPAAVKKTANETPANKTPPPRSKPQTSRAPQKRKKSREPRIDKKGFRVITNRHDLHRLFGGEEEEKKSKDSDFVRMFEESQDDIYQKRLMQDKRQAESRELPRTQKPPSVKIKTYPPPQKELDLHGYTGEEADTAAGHFIQDARRKGLQTLRIIVGKGTHSQGNPVLPGIVEGKVIGLKRQNQVIAYHWEKKDKRKSGAIIVYLA